MTVAVAVGAQWGDEGKGKVVDMLAEHASVVARYGGGANAGHTLVVGGEKVVLHLIPSGALHEAPRCVLGPGMVLDPVVLVKELEVLRSRNLLPEGRVVISDRAHLVLPHHQQVDGLREKGADAIGTTKRGIGPAYEDRVGRRGVRIGDLRDPALMRSLLDRNLRAWEPRMRALGEDPPSVESIMEAYLPLAEQIVPHVGDASEVLFGAIEAGGHVLLEGAQGTMLDVDYGTYPYVTSSTVISGGATFGAGLPPTAIDRTILISKAYTTRVGGGPFPTELEDEVGETLRRVGAEFGATTGRPRRCGWLDLPVLRQAVRVNGGSAIAMTKLDVLSGIDPLRVCVAYESDQGRYDLPPYAGLEGLRPVYEDLPGWQEDITGCRSREALPEAARAYLRWIEEQVRCEIAWVGVGPGREQMIASREAFDPNW